MCVFCVCSGKTRRDGEKVMHMTTDYAEVEQYAQYLEDHGRRPGTVRNVRYVTRRVLDILAEGGRPTSVYDLTEEDIYWLYHNLSKLSDETRMRYIGYLARLSDFYGCPHWIKRLDILRNRYEPDRIWITVEQMAELYAAGDPTDRMIIVLGAFMGLRRFEIANLRDGDIDMRARKMTIRGKGHGPEGLIDVMDIPEDVAREIQSFRMWKQDGRPRGDDYLVQAYKNGCWKRMCPNNAYLRVKKCGERCGFECTLHTLRRLYASTLVNIVEADLETVRRLMRHADISTTLRCYVNPDPSKKRTAQAGLSSVYMQALASL